MRPFWVFARYIQTCISQRQSNKFSEEFWGYMLDQKTVYWYVPTQHTVSREIDSAIDFIHNFK